MGLRIASNVQALTAQRNLNATTEANNASMEKLASGFRINKAADDSAGLAISEKLKADIRGINMARRNASDGVSLIQTAEGGLNEVGNILSRLRELAVQGSSDTVGDTERGFLNKEFSQLKNEITRIAKSTEYNGTLLIGGELDGAEPSLAARSNAYPLEIQIGKNYFESVDSKDQASPVNVLRIDFRISTQQSARMASTLVRVLMKEPKLPTKSRHRPPLKCWTQQSQRCLVTAQHLVQFRTGSTRPCRICRCRLKTRMQPTAASVTLTLRTRALS